MRMNAIFIYGVQGVQGEGLREVRARAGPGEETLRGAGCEGRGDRVRTLRMRWPRARRPG